MLGSRRGGTVWPASQQGRQQGPAQVGHVRGLSLDGCDHSLSLSEFRVLEYYSWAKKNQNKMEDEMEAGRILGLV